MKLITILESVYSGETMSKQTSIAGKEVVALVNLFKGGKINGKVLDYGCGKVDRNGSYLRSKGLEVYSYDPYWGESVDGYEGISNVLPKGKFDVAYSSYVLNVVSISEQEKILNFLKSHSKKQYHIVRNMDVYDMIKKALSRGDKTVTDFYVGEFGGDLKDIEDKDNLLTFAKFGTMTTKGFQRIPYLEDYGFTLVKKTGGYKVYSK